MEKNTDGPSKVGMQLVMHPKKNVSHGSNEDLGEWY
jgi:hypothetical protein